MGDVGEADGWLGKMDERMKVTNQESERSFGGGANVDGSIRCVVVDGRFFH